MTKRIITLSETVVSGLFMHYKKPEQPIGCPGFDISEFKSIQSNTAVLLNVVYNLVNSCECHAYAGICATVIDSNSACIGIAECCAGECNVLNVAYTLIVLSGIEEVLSATILNLPGLVNVEDSS